MVGEDRADLIMFMNINYSSLLLQEYALVEMYNLVQGNNKYKVKNQLTFVRNQLESYRRVSKATRQTFAQAEDVMTENVSLMAHLCCQAAIAPWTQIEFLEDEFAKSWKVAAKRHNDLIENAHDDCPNTEGDCNLNMCKKCLKL